MPEMVIRNFLLWLCIGGILTSISLEREIPEYFENRLMRICIIAITMVLAPLITIVSIVMNIVEICLQKIINKR